MFRTLHSTTTHHGSIKYMYFSLWFSSFTKRKNSLQTDVIYETRVPVFRHGMETCEEMNVVTKPRRLYLSNVSGHDETRGTNVSYDFSNSWANRRVTFLFTIVGLFIQIVI